MTDINTETNTKSAWIWALTTSPGMTGHPGVYGELFFSSAEKAMELIGRDLSLGEALLKVEVPMDFDNWDFIPENY